MCRRGAQRRSIPCRPCGRIRKRRVQPRCRRRKCAGRPRLGRFNDIQRPNVSCEGRNAISARNPPITTSTAGALLGLVLPGLCTVAISLCDRCQAKNSSAAPKTNTATLARIFTRRFSARPNRTLHLNPESRWWSRLVAGTGSKKPLDRKYCGSPRPVREASQFRKTRFAELRYLLDTGGAMIGGGVHAVEVVFLLLLSFVALFAALASKLRTPYPIVLVVAGLLLSFIPGIPKIT